MEILSVMSQKGGVGKTSTAFELSYWLSERGLRVLCIDLDSQLSLSNLLGLERPQDALRTSYGLLTGFSRPGGCIQSAGWADAVPASTALSDVERDISGANRLGRLGESLRHCGGDYDVCLLDCPPTMGAVDYSALMASDGLIVPTSSDYGAVTTLGTFARTIGAVKRELNPGLRILGIIVNQWDGRLRVSRDYYPDIERYAGSLGTEILGTVRRSVAVSDAQSEGRPLLESNPRHPQARDFSEAFGKLSIEALRNRAMSD